MEQDQFAFRLAWCFVCKEYRRCLKVKVKIAGKERQRQVCWECLAWACRECGKKEKN